MDIRQLRALVAVAENKSFSAAARTLHTVQSNISTHISNLERELGAPLIDRSTNELTEEGQLVATRAQAIESELNSIVADVAAMSTQVVGTVNLGVVGTTARWLVPQLIERLGAAHPSVRMRIADGTSSLLVPQVVSSRLDLAVINLPYPERAIHATPLFAEDRVLIAPGGHPLAHRPHVTLKEISEYELLLEPRGNFFRDQLDAYAHIRGFEFRPKAEIDGLRLLASMAFAGYGIAILPATAAPTWLEGDWTTVPILDVPQRAIGLARRKAGLLGAAQQVVERMIHTIVGEQIPRLVGLHPAGDALPATGADLYPARSDPATTQGS